MSDRGLVRLSEVRIEGVARRGRAGFIVRDVSLSVRPGELYTLLGAPGSGKTALLRMIAGLETPDAGRIFVDDELIDPVPPARRRIGMVFSGCALWPHLSVWDNVAFGPRAHGEDGAALARTVEAALARFGLDRLRERRAADLAGSEPLRVALARALAVKPRLLLLDEPLGGFEGGLRARMRDELAAFHRDVGTTTMLATRESADALALSTRVAVLANGAVAQEGRPEDVYWKPRTRHVAELAGAANLVPVRVVELREVGVVVETAGGARLPVASGGHAWTLGARALLCLRPEALRVEEAALAPGGLPGTVVSQAFEGGRQLYEVDIVAAALRVEMLTSAGEGRNLKPGDHVKVEVAPETSVLLPDDPARPGE